MPGGKEVEASVCGDVERGGELRGNNGPVFGSTVEINIQCMMVPAPLEGLEV